MGQTTTRANEGGYFCIHCGQKNPYPRKLSNFLIEGDYPVVQGVNQAPKPRRYEFECRHCGHKNTVTI